MAGDSVWSYPYSSRFAGLWLRKTRAGQVQTGIAPDFTLTSFDGETLTLSELRG